MGDGAGREILLLCGTVVLGCPSRGVSLGLRSLLGALRLVLCLRCLAVVWSLRTGDRQRDRLKVLLVERRTEDHPRELGLQGCLGDDEVDRPGDTAEHQGPAKPTAPPLWPRGLDLGLGRSFGGALALYGDRHLGNLL